MVVVVVVDVVVVVVVVDVVVVVVVVVVVATDDVPVPTSLLVVSVSFVSSGSVACRRKYRTDRHFEHQDYCEIPASTF